MHPDYAEMLQCLCEEGAEFLLVGAYALAVHGLVRATGDIDLWVRPTPENAARVWRALVRFGAPLQHITPKDLASPEVVFQIGVAPVRIDLLTEIDGAFDFEQAWAQRERQQIAGVEVGVLSAPLLLANKQASGRDKDQGDVAWLQKHLKSKEA